MKTLPRLIALAAAGLLLTAAGNPAPAPRANWLASVSVTAKGSHVVGNPDARVKLVEYVSYTCPHCAAFEKEASGELALGFIRPGTGSIEYRPFLRNAIDVAASLLVDCGPAEKFAGNHSAVLRAQDKWLTPVSRAQEQRWVTGDFPARMRAIAGDLHLYDLFEGRGYSRADLDRCLADKPLADRIAEENNVAMQLAGVDSTPTFLVNNRVQDAHDWQSLRPLLLAATR